MSLELLRLGDNRLTEVPASLLTLPRLAWLGLAGNPVSECVTPGPSGHLRVPLAASALGSLLGEGASGAVYGTVDAATGDARAVKVFKRASSDGRPMDEIAVHIAVPAHEGIIRALGFVDEPSDAGRCLALVLERVPGAPMGGPPSFDTVTRDTFATGVEFPVHTVLRVARRVASALMHLHANAIVHGDVYAHNVLLNDARGTELSAKLCDFGAAFFVAPRDDALRRAFELLEVRAYGCLLDDLLSRVHVADGEERGVRMLRCLADECVGAVAARPPFADVLARVAALDI